MIDKKTKTRPARIATRQEKYSSTDNLDNFLGLEEEYWESVADGAEKREKRKKPKMKVSGKSVLKIRDIIAKR